MELLVWLSVMATILAPHVAAAHFDVDGDTAAPSTILATVEPKAGAPEDKWIRLYFYSAELSPAQKEAATTAREEPIRNWAAILQLTVDAHDTVSAIDLALPGHVCTVAQSPEDSARAIQAFEFDGRSLHLETRAFSVCDLKLLGIPNPTFTWQVDIDTPVVARPSNLGTSRGTRTSPSW